LAAAVLTVAAGGIRYASQYDTFFIRGLHHMATHDQVSFYDESLKKQIEGSYRTDGKSLHVTSVYGIKSVPYNDLGASIDVAAQDLLARKLLSEIARDAQGH
jgi:hypothetical protein